MLHSGDLEFSFSGLKTAVALLVREAGERDLAEAMRADIARAFQDAVVDVLVAKCALAMERTGLTRLVVAGGVGANHCLRATLDAKAKAQGFDLFYPEPELCTDNGAMIALAAALRLRAGFADEAARAFTVRPRWDLAAAG
jgi:N6-L-threonylcarbamoyladenine synthase